jgi:hypothetical protein
MRTDVPRFIHYETEGMSTLRAVLSGSFTDQQITDFRDCLTHLERLGFTLFGPEEINPNRVFDHRGSFSSLLDQHS